jgi:DNA-binding IclR family transcriptional regulator
VTAVPAAARAMALFEIFARERRELTKSDVARLLELPESSTSDLLNTLQRIGYLGRTATTRRYYPTGRLGSMAAAIAGTDPLLSVGEHLTGLLAERTGETAVFATLTPTAVTIQAVAQGRHRLRYVVDVGDAFSTHGTALGKALLAALEPGERADILRRSPLPRLTPRTITDPAEIERHLADSRTRGWFAAADEATVGVASFAAVGRVGQHTVSLGVVGPTERIAGGVDRLVPILLDVAEPVVSKGRKVLRLSGESPPTVPSDPAD